MKLDMPHAAAGGACSLTTRRCRLLPLHARPYGRPTPAPTHRTSRRRPQSRRTAAAAPRRAAPPSCAPQQQCRSLHGQGKAGRKRGEPQAVKGSVRAPEQCKHPRLQAQRPPLAVNPPRTQPSSLRAPPPPTPHPLPPLALTHRWPLHSCAAAAGWEPGLWRSPRQHPACRGPAPAGRTPPTGPGSAAPPTAAGASQTAWRGRCWSPRLRGWGGREGGGVEAVGRGRAGQRRAAGRARGRSRVTMSLRHQSAVVPRHPQAGRGAPGRPTGGSKPLLLEARLVHRQLGGAAPRQRHLVEVRAVEAHPEKRAARSESDAASEGGRAAGAGVVGGPQLLQHKARYSEHASGAAPLVRALPAVTTSQPTRLSGRCSRFQAHARSHSLPVETPPPVEARRRLPADCSPSPGVDSRRWDVADPA